MPQPEYAHRRIVARVSPHYHRAADNAPNVSPATAERRGILRMRRAAAARSRSTSRSEEIRESEISFVAVTDKATRLGTRELKREIIPRLITSCLLKATTARDFLNDQTRARSSFSLSCHSLRSSCSLINLLNNVLYETIRKTLHGFSFAMRRIESLPGIARYGCGNDSRYRFSRFFPPVRSVCRAYTVLYAAARG